MSVLLAFRHCCFHLILYIQHMHWTFEAFSLDFSTFTSSNPTTDIGEVNSLPVMSATFRQYLRAHHCISSDITYRRLLGHRCVAVRYSLWLPGNSAWIISVTRFVFPHPCRNPGSVDVFSGDLKKPVGIERNARDPRDNEGIALRDEEHRGRGRLYSSAIKVV